MANLISWCKLIR